MRLCNVEIWLASLVIRSEGTYGRGDRRRTRGTTVVEGFRSWHKIPPRRTCERDNITLETFCGAGHTPHAGGSFFLYEKSVLRESDSLRSRRPEVCTDSTTPFSALKKPLKIMGIQGESLPLGRCSRAEPSRSSPSATHRSPHRRRIRPWGSIPRRTGVSHAGITPSGRGCSSSGSYKRSTHFKGSCRRQAGSVPA